MKRVLIFGLVFIGMISSCTKQEEVAQFPQKDSLLAKPLIQTVDTVHPTPDSTGLVVDPLIAGRSAQNDKLLARFHPKEILKVYEDYRPLRNTSISEAKLSAFLAQHKININELHAILEEGDRLGWANAH